MGDLSHDTTRMRQLAKSIRLVHDNVTKRAAEAARNRFKHSDLQQWKQWKPRVGVQYNVTPQSVEADQRVSESTPDIGAMYEALGSLRQVTLEYVAHMDTVAQSCAKGVEKAAAAYERTDRSHAGKSGQS